MVKGTKRLVGFWLGADTPKQLWLWAMLQKTAEYFAHLRVLKCAPKSQRQHPWLNIHHSRRKARINNVYPLSIVSVLGRLLNPQPWVRQANMLPTKQGRKRISRVFDLKSNLGPAVTTLPVQQNTFLGPPNTPREQKATWHFVKIDALPEVSKSSRVRTSHF